MICPKLLASALPDDRVLASFHLQLEPTPTVVSIARAFVSEHAPMLPPDTYDILLLLTSELVTNAVLHARTTLEVSLTTAEQSVLVAVHDLDHGLVDLKPDDQREGGWGLALVASLAADCATSPDQTGGKTAWFRLPRDHSPYPDDGSAARAEPLPRNRSSVT